jgi:hypothetical protein
MFGAVGKDLDGFKQGSDVRRPVLRCCDVSIKLEVDLGEELLLWLMVIWTELESGKSEQLGG